MIFAADMASYSFAVECLTVWSLVVTLYATRLSVPKYRVLPTERVFVFCVDVVTDSDYFPIRHWLGSLTEMECVYCAVGTECLNILLCVS